MAQLNLSLGIELEFICVYPRMAFTNQYADLRPTDFERGIVTAAHALMYHLQVADIPATGWEEPGTEVGAVPYSRWVVDTDALSLSTLEENELPTGYLQESIEVSSRIIFLAEDWARELERVLAVLHLMRRKYGCRFITNDTTGFHVHVGNNGGDQMPFQTARRVFQLMTAHERVFDGFHAANRVTAPTQHGEPTGHLRFPSYAPLSFFHRYKGQGNITNLFLWLQQLEYAQTYESLGKFCDVDQPNLDLSGHNAVVNFDNCFPDPGAHRPGEILTHTIEFRQHAGTLDTLEIRAYVSLLCSLVQYCHTARDDHFLLFLVQASDPDFARPDLLREVAVHPDVFAHYVPGDEQILGTLPNPVVSQLSTISTPDEDKLSRLSLQNDLEQTFNADPKLVMQKVHDKYTSFYYGWNPAVPGVPISSFEMSWLVIRILTYVVRYVVVSAAQPEELDLWASQARGMIFETLAKMYARLEPGFSPAATRNVMIGVLAELED